MSAPDSESSQSPAHPISRIAVLSVVLRSLIGLWFAYSGGVKLFVSGLDRFTKDIANYKMVGEPWDAVAAFTIPWAELLAGLFLLAGLLRKGAILVLLALVGAFSFSIGWAWWHQLDIACGCHGEDAKISYWTKVFELSAYVLILGFLWISERRALDRSLGRVPGNP